MDEIVDGGDFFLGYHIGCTVVLVGEEGGSAAVVFAVFGDIVDVDADFGAAFLSCDGDKDRSFCHFIGLFTVGFA